MLDVDVNTYLPGDLLAKMDIASMAHSLEARSPLLDHEFMQMAASLPAEMKLRGSEKKVGLARRPAGMAPRRHPRSPEARIRGPDRRLAARRPARLCARALLDSTARGRGYFRESYVQGILRRHEAGAEDNSRRIWSLLMFESGTAS